jgi:hypothetical protein
VIDDTYRIPLLVGVAGHRDLVPAERPAIREAAEQLLRTLRDAQPDVRIRLLCSLAEGADLLVAGIAVELGIDVVALLPSPATLCRAALASEDARLAFDFILQRAETLDAENAGALIALYSSLLIVIWNGDENDDAVTARVVDHRLGHAAATHDGSANADAFLFAEDNDLLYEIRCTRLATASASVQERQSVVLRGFSTGRRHVGRIEAGLPPELATLLDRTGRFNRDVARYGTRIESEARHLAADSVQQPVPDTLRYIDHLFTAADWLSARFRLSFLRALRARYALWALMVLCLVAFGNHPDGAAAFVCIAGVPFIFVVTWLLARRASQRRWHRGYLDYRALAEGLRVEFYWELGGVRSRFDGAFAHESFLQKQDVELEWIRAAMRAVSLRCALFSRTPMTDGLANAFRQWIGSVDAAGDVGQLLYYRQRAARLENRQRVAKRAVDLMLWAGLAVGGVLAVDAGLRLAESPLLPDDWRTVLVWALSLLTAYGAIFGIYFDERADAALIAQYRQMHSLMRFAARELGSARSNPEKLAILRSLGQACLAEHAQWILSQRDKRIEGMRW